MRHFPGLWILFYTLKASVKELLLLLLFLCVGMLFFASLIYYSDSRETFTSIPRACWWSIITMTTGKIINYVIEKLNLCLSKT